MKAPELKEKLYESEKLIQEMTITWEEKLRKTEEIATVGRAETSALLPQVTRESRRSRLPAQERQKQLESMGISLESSGIKVGDDKCFLVNLNADPALNELLVYYLKVRSHTLVHENRTIHVALAWSLCLGSQRSQWATLQGANE